MSGISHYTVYVTPPGKNTTPLGLVEADTEDSAWLLAARLIQNKCSKDRIHPESLVELVDPDGRWLEQSSTVGEHLMDIADATAR